MELAEQKMTDEQKAMIEKFQCLGCTCGYRTDECDQFDFTNMQTGCWCLGHSAGTFMSGAGKIALGLPKGFNRVGTIKTGFETESDRNARRSTNIRLMTEPPKVEQNEDGEGKSYYDEFNVPVWAMEEDGYLFVRVMCPRINYTYVDVIKGGKFSDICPNAIDVGEFHDEID